MRHQQLHVVTHRSWIADELRQVGPRLGVDVQHSYGLDIPAGQTDDAWWAPTEWAARAQRAGYATNLTSPGPRFLNAIPQEFTRRRVLTASLSELELVAPAAQPGFFKLAEVKSDQVPAQTWRDRDTFRQACRHAGIPDTTIIQYSPTITGLDAEFRCFILAGQVAASSVYKIGPHLWQEGMRHPSGHTATDFAQDVTRALPDQPAGYVLDVGRLQTGSWVVIEANPAWCSAFYGAHLEGVLETILASNTPNPWWSWKPDPYLAYKANRARLLPVDTRTYASN